MQSHRPVVKRNVASNNLFFAPLMKFVFENAIKIWYYDSAYTMYRTAARPLKPT